MVLRNLILDPQRIRIVVEEIRPRLPVIIGDDLGPSLPELITLLRIQIILRPVRNLEVVVVGVLVVDERHDGGHDVERVVADGVRDCLEEVEESVESVERPEDRRRRQAGAAEQLADDGVVEDGEWEGDLGLVVPDGALEVRVELAAAGFEDEVALDGGDALILGSNDGVKEPAAVRGSC